MLPLPSVQAIAHLSGSCFFDLSPRNTDGHYPGKAVAMLLHMVFKVGLQRLHSNPGNRCQDTNMHACALPPVALDAALASAGRKQSRLTCHGPLLAAAGGEDHGAVGDLY